MSLTALMAASCTDTDTENLNNTPQASDHALKSVTTYWQASANVLEFKDNQIIRETFLNGSVPDGYIDFTYNQFGQLFAQVHKDRNGEVVFERSLSYDTQGRLIAKNDAYYNGVQMDTITEDVVFLYDDVNNTVFADYSPTEGSPADRTFHFNTAGLLSYIDIEGSDQVLQYDGNNIININGLQFNCNYQYDSQAEVKGEYLNRYRNSFSTYQNFILYGISSPYSYSDKYLVNVDDTGVVGDFNFTYQFNQNGYPVEVHQVPVNGVTEAEVKIVIEYY